MSRYIDVGDAKARFKGWKHERSICEEIDAVESVDAVPVVRCNDCIHSRPDEYGLECMVHYRPTKEDDFCSYGEKVTE